jgi:hypothetical protein
MIPQMTLWQCVKLCYSVAFKIPLLWVFYICLISGSVYNHVQNDQTLWVTIFDTILWLFGIISIACLAGGLCCRNMLNKVIDDKNEENDL